MPGRRTGLPPQEARTESSVAVSPTTATQPTAGQHARDEGAADALAALDHLTRQAVADSIAYLAATRYEPWSADDVWVLLDDAGIDLAQPRLSGGPSALGGAFRKAKNDGLITPVGFTTSRRTSRHAGVQRLWLGVEVIDR